jgi:L-amino acid N-acyltransferase YncA
LKNKFKTDPCVGHSLRKTISGFSFDQYRMYRAIHGAAWMDFLFRRIEALAESDDGEVFFKIIDGSIYLVGCRIPRWDEEHFGFGMAKIDWIISPGGDSDGEVIGGLLDQCLCSLRERGVRFASSHISSSDLPNLHLLEDRGFRYNQTTAYALAESMNCQAVQDASVRLWNAEDLPAVTDIARRSQFREGHFYNDTRFERGTVDLMYEKWIQTSWRNQEPVAVIETEGKVSGYFAFVMDESLSSSLGRRYGRMTSLAIDASIHGAGLGSRLFGSVIAIIKGLGGELIASEYSTKNFASANLHARNRFSTVHEKILSHLWL